MIEIDGSMGEGGGQVLRTSLTLSILTRQPFRIYNIRLNRSTRGLRPQHVQAVKAAAQICHGEVSGAQEGSLHVEFQPGEIQSGRYRFEIGTAGAVTLVLQTILIPLAHAPAASEVYISGGTHVQWSPVFEYLTLQWLPYLQMIGYESKLDLDRAGFYPQGGGRIRAIVRPSNANRPIELLQRGKLRELTGISAVCNLDPSIAERQKRQAIQRLASLRYAPRIKLQEYRSQNSKGTVFLLHAQFENGSACFSSLGAVGKPAERVADEAVDDLITFMESSATIDHHLADQLLLPLALLDQPSAFHTNQVSQHLVTNAAVINRFIPVPIQITGEPLAPGLVRIGS